MYILVLMANELRSRDVHEKFIGLFSQHFTIEQVQAFHMHPIYQHPTLGMYRMKRKTFPAMRMYEASNYPECLKFTGPAEPMATLAGRYAGDATGEDSQLMKMRTNHTM